MADESDERTEQPTARRLQEAREQGRIARSADLTAAVVLLGGMFLLKVLGPHMVATMLNLARAIGEPPDLAASSLEAWTARIVLAGLYLLLVFVGLLVVIVLVTTAMQSGLPLSFRRLAPRLDHLNPVVGLKRLYSLDSLVRLALGLLKTLIVAAVAYAAIYGNIGALLSAGSLDPRGAFSLGSHLVYRLALRVGLVLLILALLDYWYQRWNWWRNLKMTKQEVKDELRNMEGDPLIRQRRRRAQLQLALQRISAAVPKSDVVVTNPTEFAVALAYDEATMAAPRVTAKGQDFLALRIRQIAQQHGIPIVQRPPLARALYAAVELGQEIPPTFYRAVAEVLAYVYQLSGKAMAHG